MKTISEIAIISAHSYTLEKTFNMSRKLTLLGLEEDHLVFSRPGCTSYFQGSKSMSLPWHLETRYYSDYLVTE